LGEHVLGEKVVIPSLSATHFELRDVFKELSARAMVISKDMGSDLMKIGSADNGALKAQLVKSASSLQAAFEANTILVDQNKDLEADFPRLKLDGESLRPLGSCPWQGKGITSFK